MGTRRHHLWYSHRCVDQAVLDRLGVRGAAVMASQETRLYPVETITMHSDGTFLIGDSVTLTEDGTIAHARVGDIGIGMVIEVSDVTSMVTIGIRWERRHCDGCPTRLARA